MHVAFYAPLKPPSHPKPSGDRTFARALLDTLKSIEGVEKVTIASTLQTRDGDGLPEVQKSLLSNADKELKRLSSSDFDAWITYHNYYKAPDLIGPNYAKAKGIPYLQIESTRASKRLTGPWADFAAKAEAATDAADTVFYLTTRDREALAAAKPDNQTLTHLPPFLNRDELPTAKRPVAGLKLLSVAMLRTGDKLASYTALAEALKHVTRPDWTLNIVGDGPARADVEALFADFGDQVSFQGEAAPKAVATAMSEASCLLWPGVNEAFGMVYLEAQALGLRVIAEDRPGVREVVGPLGSLAPPNDPAAFASFINFLPTETNAEITETRRYMRDRLRPSARRILAQALGLAQ